MIRRIALAVGIGALLSGGACGGGGSSSGQGGATSSSGGSGGASSSSAGSGGARGSSSSTSASSSAGVSGTGGGCSSPTQGDIYIAFDRSSSMAGNKWDGAKLGLSAFVADPSSAGLGVALNFFPLEAG